MLSLFDMSDVNSQISNPPLAPFTTKGGLWPHRLAVVLACATFPLLFIGGLVTSKGAGLAVPDWPTTFGYNMFLYPWSEMVGNILYEHSHRLVASCVGLLTIALAMAPWFGERRTWLRWLGVTALLVVIAQGILGGLRVVLRQDTFAILHACLAQAARLKLVRLAGSLGILLLVQLLLGVGSYFAKFTTLLQLAMDMVVFLTTTHVIVGALTLVTSLALTLHSYRLSERAKPALRPNASKEQFST